MMRSIITLVAGALCVLAVLSPGCKPTVEQGDTIVNIPTQPTEEAVTLTSAGWVAFGQKNYTGAAALFRQAIGKNDIYADAYNGLGWTYLKLDSTTLALEYFDIAIGVNPSLIDGYAGHAFVALALGRYREAIGAVQHIQDAGLTFYVFRHDPTISINDLLLVKAQSLFLLGEYGSAQDVIDKLDPSNRLDPTSPGYIEALAGEIEALWAIL